MSSLVQYTFKQLKKLLLKKEVSAVEVIKDYQKQAEKCKHLNLFITDSMDQALKRAEESDKRYKAGESLPLDGLPLGVKDMFCTKGIRTTAGSKMLSHFVPTYESHTTNNLLKAGAITLGKTNLDEFAMGSSTITSFYGPSISPWTAKNEPDADLTPGGSSGGSSAAVAAGAALVATGTDTGGSIRQPASFCGIVGLKPTYGLCSRYGVVSFASSLDHPGPFARTVSDTALVLEHMAGHDPKDSTSLNVSIPAYAQHLTGDLKGLRVGIPTEYDMPGLSKTVKALWDQAADWLTKRGCEVVSISLPHTKYGLPTYYIIAPAEASSNLARYDGVRYGMRAAHDSLEEMYVQTRTEGFSDEVMRRIMIGTYVLSSESYQDYYVRAQKVRRKVADDFKKAFSQVDLILTPTSPEGSFKLGENLADPVAMYLQDIFTVTSNLAGVPAISVPAGLTEEGLPLGIQLIGPALSEQLLLNAAYALEQEANFELLSLKRMLHDL